MKKLLTAVAILFVASSANAGFFSSIFKGEGKLPSWAAIEKNMNLYVPVGGYSSPAGIDLFNACDGGDDYFYSIEDVSTCEEYGYERNPEFLHHVEPIIGCLLYTSPSPRDATLSRMPSSA